MYETDTKRVPLRQQQHRAADSAVHRQARAQSRRRHDGARRPVEALRTADEVAHVDAQVVAGASPAAVIFGLQASEVFPVHSRTLRSFSQHFI